MEFTYRPTGKISPALEFITSIGDRIEDGAGMSWTFPAERLASVEYDPDEKCADRARGAGNRQSRQDSRPARHRHSVPLTGPTACSGSGRTCTTSTGLRRPLRNTGSGSNLSMPRRTYAPGSTLETALTNIWRKVLGRPQIGMNDNFFEAGGTSLRAVQVIAMIKKELKQTPVNRQSVRVPDGDTSRRQIERDVRRGTTAEPQPRRRRYGVSKDDITR